MCLDGEVWNASQAEADRARASRTVEQRQHLPHHWLALKSDELDQIVGPRHSQNVKPLHSSPISETRPMCLGRPLPTWQVLGSQGKKGLPLQRSGVLQV